MLCKIFADFKVLSNKIHVLHVSMNTDLFLSYHPFLGEIYDFLEWQIDAIMEDMEQLGFKVPVNLDELLDESDIVELTEHIEDPKKQMPIVDSDLKYMIDNLQKGIELSGEKKDFVIQNNLIDLQKKLRIFKWKNYRMMDCKG